MMYGDIFIFFFLGGGVNISQGQFGYTDPYYPSTVISIVDHIWQMFGGYKLNSSDGKLYILIT